MWDKIVRGRQRHGLRGYLRRWITREADQLVHRVTSGGLAEALRRLGIERGAVVCVHSALSKLGYVQDGPRTIIEAVQRAVGPEGTILMPTFPMTGSMRAHVESSAVFDVRSTPSQVGLVTEVFRQAPGVCRSLHPTNSVAAWGALAEALLRDHELSPTPFGPATPYGRLAERDDAFILMLETHIHSFLHHLQDRVGLPTLYLPATYQAPIVDQRGERRVVSTRVIREHVSYFIAIPSLQGEPPDWAILHDYALMFPGRREAEVQAAGYLFSGYPLLHRRRAQLEACGALRATTVGRGEIGALHVRRFLSVVEPELRELIDRFRTYYDPAYIASLGLRYL